MSTEARRTPAPPSDAGGSGAPKAVPPPPPPPAASARFPDTLPDAPPPPSAPAPAPRTPPAGPPEPPAEPRAEAAPADPVSEPAGAPPEFTLSARFRVPLAPDSDDDTGTVEVGRNPGPGSTTAPAGTTGPHGTPGRADAGGSGRNTAHVTPRQAGPVPGPGAPAASAAPAPPARSPAPQPPAAPPSVAAPPLAPPPPAAHPPTTPPPTTPPAVAPDDPAATGAGHRTAVPGQGAGQDTGHGEAGAAWPAFAGAAQSGAGETSRLWSTGSRPRSRTVAAAACLVLGLGLLGGAVTGTWLTGDSSAAGSAESFAAAAGLWHNTPVDQLFPPVVHARNAGPGGADRTWTRIAVAPDSDCAGAFDPLLQKALAPVGCLRLLRATYTDATRSYVTTVGLLFTRADAAGMRALHTRFTTDGLDRRTDLMPRPYAAKNTPAAHFGTAQRASWTVSVRTDAPLVVYAVSGFADGRTVHEPQPAAEAVKPTATTAPAQAGLGHEAKGLAERVESGVRRQITGDDGDSGDGTEQS